MTNQTAVEIDARRTFNTLRIDPTKAADGVWVQHPETKDRFLLRRLHGAAYRTAIAKAIADYETLHGEGSGASADGNVIDEVLATSLATGIVADWKLAGAHEGRPYDATALAAALADPGLVDLRNWILRQCEDRRHFRPDGWQE